MPPTRLVVPRVRLIAVCLLVVVLGAAGPVPASLAADGVPRRDAQLQLVESGRPCPPGGGNDSPAERAARCLEAIRHQPLLLYAFLRQMPKGGDLHSHLSGAVYAESLIEYGVEDGLCIVRTTMIAVAPPCDAAGATPIADALRDSQLFSDIVEAWSMRAFVPGPVSGHDQFFNTFGKFGLATDGRTGDMLAEVASRAAAQNEQYLELMVGWNTSGASALGRQVGWDDDLARFRQKLLDAGLDQVVATAREQVDAAEASMRERLRCDTPQADPGCDVVVRYLYQTNRVIPPEQTFAQFVAGWELVRQDPRVVGLNLVAPEDNYAALRNYDLHMTMLGFLRQVDPAVPLSLHAGELAPGLVPPEQLRFHIRHAVEVAQARRIGHGVDVLYEDDPFGLLQEMARREVMVEINLTSNDVILGVTGANHPFPIYRRFGVPVALSTDDEGVSRSSLTHEFQRAVETYQLGYDDLKGMVRTSLEHAFLPGESLWRSDSEVVEACAADTAGSPAPSEPCLGWLESNEKARLQWRLEAAFAEFERGF